MYVGCRFSSAGLSGFVRLAAFGAFGVAVALCQADASSSSSAEDYIVSLPVTVTDSSGRPVRGLGEQDFSVTEDGEPQTIRAFADKNIPLSLALIVDTSEFTGGFVDQVKSTDDLAPALRRVREELQSQYLIAYVSARGQDGKAHEVKVSVKNPEPRVRARQSYTAKKR